MAADGTPRITWHGKDFAATTEIVKLGEIETSIQVPAVDDLWLRRFIAGLAAFERIGGANRLASAHAALWRRNTMVLGCGKVAVPIGQTSARQCKAQPKDGSGE